MLVAAWGKAPGDNNGSTVAGFFADRAQQGLDLSVGERWSGEDEAVVVTSLVLGDGDREPSVSSDGNSANIDSFGLEQRSQLRAEGAAERGDRNGLGPEPAADTADVDATAASVERG